MTYLIGLLLLGTVFGSFLNVLAHRLPRREGLVRPGSHCPRCRTSIAARDNIPLLSFVLLRGRCRSCTERIPARYPIVELTAGGLAVLCGLRGASIVEVALCSFFCWTLLAAAVTDLEHGIIPDALPVFLVALGILRGFVEGNLVDPLVGLVAGGGGFALLGVVYRLIRKREGFGMGDVKLMAGIGAFGGWQGAIVAAAIASALGTLVVVAVAASGRTVKGTTPIPFAPFLAVGGGVAALAGAAVLWPR